MKANNGKISRLKEITKKCFEGFDWKACINYFMLLIVFIFGAIVNNFMFEMLLMIIYALCLYSYAAMGPKQRQEQILDYRSSMAIVQCALMEITFYIAPFFAFLLNHSYFTLGLYSIMLFVFTVVCKYQIQPKNKKKNKNAKN